MCVSGMCLHVCARECIHMYGKRERDYACWGVSVSFIIALCG